jgi:MoaA/NifB/PqqE/SkfB family radical SAM enzyme
MRVDWFVTRLCDQARFCTFCNAPWNAFPPDVSVGRSLEMCDRLVELGVTVVTICGGEPFKYKGLDLVVRKLHALGIKVVLYTSGTSDNYDVMSFLPFIDFLSLPVDAVSPEAVSLMRGSSQFERVSGIFRVLKERNDRPKIKIGTVVSKRSIGDLANIGDFLHGLGIVDVWRLYQFSPYGIGKRHEDSHLLDADTFDRAVVAEKERSASLGRRSLISQRSREDNKGYCMIMDSEGCFYRYEENYIPLGVSLRNSPQEIAAGYDPERHERQKAWHTGS